MALTPQQLGELRMSPVGEAGNRVGAALKLAGVTQVQVATAIGESQPEVSSVVTGRYQTILLSRARKFAEYFGCSIEDLFPPTKEAVA